MSLSDEDGKLLVKTAREVVTEYIKTGKKIPLPESFKNKFSFKSGAFVTINDPNGLRGCIGIPLPEKKLYDSVIDAAISSATQDPRFSSVTFDEINDISFEITVLTPPARIQVEDPSEYPKKIKVGRDGLIIKWENGSGLLLPQVPGEHGWNEEEFLSQTCEKAGAPRDSWKRKETVIEKFEGIIFKESKPNGEVIRVKLE